MCGICGYITQRPLHGGTPIGDVCRSMTDTLSHRGPDAGGVWADEPAGVALGHRRLAIIDLSPTGAQPMESKSRELVLVYNGEIYNFPEMRRELESLGHAFNGNSDTEVLLATISKWGVREAVQRCIGMFAFALWNKTTRSLTLVRDRLGIKPLYYGRIGEALVFASELKAFQAVPEFAAEIDRDTLAAYFRFSYVPSPHAIFKGLNKLAPGEMVTFQGTQPPLKETYWDCLNTVRTGHTSPFDGDLDAAVSHLEILIADAVKKRMVSDVPIGTFLSGGIDSSLVTTLMQSQSDSPVKTFSIGFNEQQFNEAPYARAVAEYLGTEHTELYVDSNMLLDVIPELPQIWDEPFADSSQVPTFILSKLTREHVTVCLSGDGGDELFHGYARYGVTNAMWNKLSMIPRPIRSAAAEFIKKLPDSLFNALGKRGRNYQWRIDGLKLATFQEFYRFILSSNHAPCQLVLGSTERQTSHLDSLPSIGDDPFALMAFLDTTNYLPDDILTKVDRASMAVGLEARVPLLDHRVVEFANSLPTSMKRGEYGDKTVLKALLSKYIPRKYFDRPKSGFGIPIELWLNNELRDWCEDLLDSKRIREEGYLDPGFVARMWREYRMGRMSWHSSLWSVLMFQSWLEKWK